MANPTLGVGRGGKSFQDREKAAHLRHTAIDSLQKVMDNDPTVETWSEYKKQMLLKLAPSLLPRLNEHTGTDGKPIQIVFDNSFTS
jgi:hypothetical protein